jgi:putative redox protein
MEMLLIGLGGCTAFDVVQILRKGREKVTDCEVEVTAERAETDPKVFTSIHIEYRVKGRGLAPAKVERAIELSKEKYCSASIMLGAVAKITHSWSAIDEAEETEAASS